MSTLSMSGKESINAVVLMRNPVGSQPDEDVSEGDVQVSVVQGPVPGTISDMYAGKKISALWRV